MLRNEREFSERRGFTLIELLIVVAIIAILAAIAVPNFLEAQTRSKVSRVLADGRSIRTALEAYRVDHNTYPETDFSTAALANGWRSLYRITTPVAFMTSIPKTPFNEKWGTGGNPKISTVNKHMLYVRRMVTGRNPAPETVTAYAGTDTDTNYRTDRIAYLMATGALSQLDAVGLGGEYMMKSVGPNNVDDRDAPPIGFGNQARVYDPTNGTASDGDIVLFSDIAGTGKNN